MGGEHGQVLGRVGIALLALVAGHEGRIKMLRTRMGEFVEHPRRGHSPILSLPGPMALATFSPAICAALPAGQRCCPAGPVAPAGSKVETAERVCRMLLRVD